MSICRFYPFFFFSYTSQDNVVVTETGDARICDFGGSRIADASRSVAKPSTGVRGTQRYLAYELTAFPDQYPGHTSDAVSIRPPSAPNFEEIIMSGLYK